MLTRMARIDDQAFSTKVTGSRHDPVILINDYTLCSP